MKLLLKASLVVLTAAQAYGAVPSNRTWIQLGAKTARALRDVKPVTSEAKFLNRNLKTLNFSFVTSPEGLFSRIDLTCQIGTKIDEKLDPKEPNRVVSCTLTDIQDSKEGYMREHSVVFSDKVAEALVKDFEWRKSKLAGWGEVFGCEEKDCPQFYFNTDGTLAWSNIYF